MKSSFINSIWLVSSVKEWMFRSFGMGNIAVVGMFLMDVSRNGATKPVLTTLILALLTVNIFSALFIGNLYRKYLKSELTNKEDLFKI